MEQSLSGIAKGKENKTKFLANIRQHAEALVKELAGQHHRISP